MLNRPLNYIDPSGHREIDPSFVGGGGGSFGGGGSIGSMDRWVQGVGWVSAGTTTAWAIAANSGSLAIPLNPNVPGQSPVSTTPLDAAGAAGAVGAMQTPLDPAGQSGAIAMTYPLAGGSTATLPSTMTTPLDPGGIEGAFAGPMLARNSQAHQQKLNQTVTGLQLGPGDEVRKEQKLATGSSATPYRLPDITIWNGFVAQSLPTGVSAPKPVDF